MRNSAKWIEHNKKSLLFNHPISALFFLPTILTCSVYCIVYTVFYKGVSVFTIQQATSNGKEEKLIELGFRTTQA